MRSGHRCAVAVALSGLMLAAQADDLGPYATIALGRTTYDADCSLFGGCSGGRASAGKIGGGYRFGVFALEAWVIDWGKAPIYDAYGDDRLRLRSLGVSAAWHKRFGPSAQGSLRAGAALVRQARSQEDFEHVEGTFGLELSFDVAPTLSIGIGYDLTSSTGGSDRIGSALAQLVTVGLRLRF